jgi:hypothetical protein
MTDGKNEIKGGHLYIEAASSIISFGSSSYNKEVEGMCCQVYVEEVIELILVFLCQPLYAKVK